MEKNWKLIWQEEFDYEGRPDPSKWGYELGAHGWGNGESQNYTNHLSNAYVSNGTLKIVALKEPDQALPYTSSRLSTFGKASWQYGRIEVRGKLPKGDGTWPAIWMLSDSIKAGKPWPLAGEIDIMEHVGKDQDMIHVSLHSEAYNHKINTQTTFFQSVKGVSDDFHVYAIEWDQKGIEFLVDGQSFAHFFKGENGKRTDEAGWPFDQPFYLILNVALGGFWGGAIDDRCLPQVMEIDYIRVYEEIKNA